MKILTWNILASEWIKQSYFPKVDKSVVFNRKARFAQICKILQEYDADIIMLQEVMKKEYMQLLSLFEKQYIISGLKKMSWYNKKSESIITFLFLSFTASYSFLSAVTNKASRSSDKDK